MKNTYCKNLFVVGFSVLSFISCKKEATNWDVDMLIPLINADLSIKNLVKEENIALEDDSTLKFVLSNTLFEFNPLELAKIPDTTIIESFTLPVPGSISLNPGNLVFTSTTNNNFGSAGATLRLVYLREGKSEIKLTSNVLGRLRVKYTLPKVTKDGVPFVAEQIVPAATTGQTVTINRTLDLSGFKFDLTGLNGQSANNFNAIIEIFVSEDAGGPVQIGAGNAVSVENTLKGVIPQYAQGYFGSQKISEGADTTKFDIFKSIIDGTLDLERVRLNFVVKNGVGVDGSIRINELKGINTKSGNSVSLNHAIVGNTFNINRAVDRLYYPEKVIPSVRSFIINEQNSNVLNFIQLFPDELIYNIDITTNPLGNISGGNDFLEIENGLSVNLDAEIPLNFYANNLTFLDTLEIDFKENLDDVKNIELTLLAKNKLPLSAKLQVYMVDIDNMLTDSISNSPINIQSAVIGSNFTSSAFTNSQVKIPFNQQKTENLKQSKKLIIKASFSTPLPNQKIRILEEDKIEINIGAKALYNVNL
jgi:hypothetical protein